MNIADTLRGLLRRWYIIVPGIILAIAGAVGAYAVIAPGYERTATQLLLPGEGTVPPGVTNPYLYLGGLTQASDIVVRVMQGEDVAGKVLAEYPGAEVLIQRDPTVSGPVIQIVVTAGTDAAAGGALNALVAESAVVLNDLQEEQNVSADDKMSISTLTQDTTSTLQQKTRLVMSAAVAVGIVIFSLVIASLVDGLARRPRAAGRRGGEPAATRTSRADAESAAAGEEESDADAELGALVDDVLVSAGRVDADENHVVTSDAGERRRPHIRHLSRDT